MAVALWTILFVGGLPHAQMASLGLLGICVPPDCGGAGMDYIVEVPEQNLVGREGESFKVAMFALD